jgi:hypothetical protein
MMKLALKAALLTCALAVSAQANAALYILNLTGTVSSGTTATVDAFGSRFDFFIINLQGFDPLTLVAGDEVQAKITLDQSLTVPSAMTRNLVRLFLINDSFPGTSSGVNGTTELFNGGTSFLLAPSGGGTSSAVVNSYQNSLGTSFTFDAVQSNFTVDSLGAPSLYVDRASLDYVLANPLAAVPEPATWAMMIVGFGLVGAGMRRRARVTITYA